jgi:hydrogenase nickel incorporation protein HypB
MCATCGCDSDVNISIRKIEQPQKLNLNNLQFTKIENKVVQTTTRKQIDVEQDILLKNNLQAERNRGYYLAKNMVTFNLVSSPGSGKTSLLEQTLKDLKDKKHISVIEGDQQTTNDADRIASTGASVVQINTGKGCHLDSEMIWKATRQLNPQNDSILFIENIGNLVCPAMFDLGENKRVVIISVTEGDDKPIKYPDMFASSQLCIINKIDLLPYVNFDIERVKKYARMVNPSIEFIELSCATGEGLNEWYDWLTKEHIEIPITI